MSHQGDSSGGVPTCSAEAFAAARSLGFRHIETDIRASKDRHLLALHDVDDSIDGRPFYELTRDEIELHYGRPLADISALMSLPFDDISWNFEVKGEHDAAVLRELLEANPSWCRRICVSWGPTFGLARRVRRDLVGTEDLVTAASLTELIVRLLLSALTLGRWRRPTTYQCAQYHWRLTSKSLVRSLHGSGTAVHVWGINDKTDMERLLQLGVDAIFSGNHAAMLAVLGGSSPEP